MPTAALRLLWFPPRRTCPELPNKIGLGRGQCFTARAIHRGWILVGAAASGALAANAALPIALRARRRPFGVAAAAAMLIAATLAVFFAWIFPTNQATADWTVVPQGWDALRVRWE